MGAALVTAAGGALPSRSSYTQGLEPKQLIASAITAEKAALRSIARGKTQVATKSLGASVAGLQNALKEFRPGAIHTNLSKAISSDKVALKNLPSHKTKATSAINLALKAKAAALAAIPPDKLYAKVTLTFFGAAAASSPGPGVHDSAKANEVKGQGQVEDEDPENGEPEDDSMRRANLSPVDAIKFVVPPNGAATRQIIAVLCPSQLPTSHIQTTASQNDTLVCDGGSLAVDAMFTFNVRTVPDPTSGMGGQLFLREDGVFKGPFPVTGP